MDGKEEVSYEIPESISGRRTDVQHWRIFINIKQIKLRKVSCVRLSLLNR